MRVIRSVAASPIGRPGVSDSAAYSLASAVCSADAEASAKSVACQAPGSVGSSSGRARSQAPPRAPSVCRGVVTVTSTIDDIFEKRAGVCQDFAHLTLACLRGHGLAARYVSGYLATEPPPGKERIVGADASHAWVEVWLPDPTGGAGEWLAIDPTNDQWAGDRYVTVAWGRDYGDVPPVKGVIFTEAKRSTLRVEVDVAPL